MISSVSTLRYFGAMGALIQHLGEGGGEQGGGRGRGREGGGGGGRGGDEELTRAQAVSGHTVMEAHKHIKLSMKYHTSHCTMT